MSVNSGVWARQTTDKYAQSVPRVKRFKLFCKGEGDNFTLHISPSILILWYMNLAARTKVSNEELRNGDRFLAGK